MLYVLLGVAVIGALAVGGSAWFMRSSGRFTQELAERNPEIAWHDGKQAMMDDDLDTAMRSLSRAVEQSADPQVRLQFDLARAAQKSGDLVAAASHYRDAADKSVRNHRLYPGRPLFVEPFFGLAQIHQRQGDPAGEQRVWKELLAADAKQYPAHYRLCVIAAMQRELDVAITHLLRCIELLPREHRGGVIDFQCQSLLGDLQLSNGDMPAALATYERAALMQPRNAAVKAKIENCKKLLAEKRAGS
jgi:tetratricopeptide (TPR) repeat protein